MRKWASVAARSAVSATAIILCALAVASPAPAALIITGVVDGNETGGVPKGIELYATTDEPDLSIYSIGRYTDGGTELSSVTALAGSLQRGDFYYISGSSSSDAYFGDAGITVDLSSKAVASINGNDLLRLVLSSDSAVALDTFGRPGQGDTDFYANSIAYRVGGNVAPDPEGSLSAEANFAVAPWTGTDQLAQTFGSFRATAIPEPSSMVVLPAIASLCLLRPGRYVRGVVAGPVACAGSRCST